MAQRNLYVGNISFRATEDEVKELFSQFGPISSSKFNYDRETGKSKGFAFVEYENHESARAAINALNGRVLHERPLKVAFSDNERPGSQPGGGPGMNQRQGPPSSGPQGQQSYGRESFSSGGGSYPQQSSHHHSQQQSHGQHSSHSSTTASAASSSSVAAPLQEVTFDEAVAALSHDHKYDVVFQMKQLTERAPDEAKALLASQPVLCVALLRLMADLNMLKTPTQPAQNAPPQAAVAGQPAVGDDARLLVQHVMGIKAQLQALGVGVDALPGIMQLANDQISVLPENQRSIVFQLQSTLRPLGAEELRQLVTLLQTT
jgi:hypothetical protein